MKKKIKSLIVYFLNPIILKLGYEKKTETKSIIGAKNNLIDNCLEILKSVNFYPNHIVDIGANRGSWTREVLRHFPEANYTLFEPQKELHGFMEDLLVNPKIESVACGVGDVDEKIPFTFLDRDDSSSFIYSEEQAREEGNNQAMVPVVTLNKFFENSNKPFPDMIKIDAEGLDLKVLKGATQFLGKTEVILIEAAVVCKAYDNMISEVLNVMDGYGYKLFEITDMNRPLKLKVLWLTELVFVLKNGFIDSQNFS